MRNHSLKRIAALSFLAIVILFACKTKNIYGEELGAANLNSASPTNSTFKDYLGINAFEWNFASEKVHEKVDEGRFNVIKSFSGIRHYLDWERIESIENKFTYSVTHSGGWDYDEIYRRMKLANKFVLIDLKGCPAWLLATYPEGQRDAENVPAPFGLDRKLPESYIKQAKIAFQIAARYGANKKIDKSLLSVDTTIRWPQDKKNEVKVGLDYVNYIECDNERDKWWKGANAQQSAEEYAANLSAFYDGHKGKLGKNVGVKNADPNMVVVMGGIANATPEFVTKMIEWCRKNRGTKADGAVDLCFDVINYHLYSNDAFQHNGKASMGMAPELSNLRSVAQQFRAMSKAAANNIPVWVTETGYDVGSQTPQRAIPIAGKSSLVTQADWNLRTALLYARSGIDKCIFYMLDDVNFNSDVQYSSSGFINANFSKRPAADYFLQANTLMGEYHYDVSLSADPIVDVYRLKDKKMYVLAIPDQIGRTANYTLDLGAMKHAIVHTLQIGQNQVANKTVDTVNGKLKLEVSETPIFVEGY